MHLRDADARGDLGLGEPVEEAKLDDAALALVERQIDELPAGGPQNAQRRALRTRAEQLGILAALQTGNAEVVQPASPPSSCSAGRGR